MSDDVNGHIRNAFDQTAHRGLRYTTDSDGQALNREEVIGAAYDGLKDVVGGNPDHQHQHYYLDGRLIGNRGNDGIDRVDYGLESGLPDEHRAAHGDALCAQDDWV